MTLNGGIFHVTLPQAIEVHTLLGHWECKHIISEAA